MITKLSNGALHTAYALLNSTGWSKDFHDIYAAGKLLSRLPDLGSGTITLREGAHEVDFSDKEVECINKALKHRTTQGDINPSPWIVELMDALSIKP